MPELLNYFMKWAFSENYVIYTVNIIIDMKVALNDCCDSVKDQRTVKYSLSGRSQAICIWFVQVLKSRNSSPSQSDVLVKPQRNNFAVKPKRFK